MKTNYINLEPALWRDVARRVRAAHMRGRADEKTHQIDCGELIFQMRVEPVDVYEFFGCGRRHEHNGRCFRWEILLRGQRQPRAYFRRVEFDGLQAAREAYPNAVDKRDPTEVQGGGE